MYICKCGYSFKKTVSGRDNFFEVDYINIASMESINLL